MKKIINDPKNFVDEMLEGILSAHPEQLKCVNNNLIII
jgi:dihydroxyacetone kinase